MPRGKKKVVAEVDLGPLAQASAKVARLRKRVDAAGGAVKALPQMLKRLSGEYAWDGGMDRPATARELGEAIERMGDGIHKIEDAIEDFRRRLSFLETKVFPDGSPGAGQTTEGAFAKSLANTIAQKPSDVQDTEGEDII